MNTASPKDMFAKKMFFRLLVPGTAAALPYTLGDTADAIIVGNYAGTSGLAALGICSCIFMFLNIVMYSFSLGCASRFSVLMGKGDIQGAEKCFNDTFKTALMTGILISAAGLVLIRPLIGLLGGAAGGSELYEAVKDYLSVILAGAPVTIGHYVLESCLINDNHQGIANIGSVAGSVSNVFLTFLMVAGFHMGTFGAGLSTVISQAIPVAIYIPAILDKGSHLRFTDRKADFRSAFSCFASGMSVNIGYLYQTLFLIVMNNLLIITLGGMGVAVFEITRNLYYLYMYLWEGNEKAMQPLVSTYSSEKNYLAVRYVKRLAIFSSLAVDLSVTGFAVLFPRLICLLFGYDDAATLSEACAAVRIYAVSAVFSGIYTCRINYEQAIGQERRAAVMNTIRGFFSTLLCAVLFSLLWPKRIWYFYPASELLALVICALWRKAHPEPEFRFDAQRIFSKTITNREEDMVSVSDELSQFCKKWHLNRKQAYYLSLAVEELGVIMLKYGFVKKKEGWIHITVVADEDGTALFCMRDTAEKFDPFSLETQKMISVDQQDTDTLGVQILKSRAIGFYYRHYQGFNTMLMRF